MLAFGPRGFSRALGSYDLTAVGEVKGCVFDPVPERLGVDGGDGCAWLDDAAVVYVVRYSATK